MNLIYIFIVECIPVFRIVYSVHMYVHVIEVQTKYEVNKIYNYPGNSRKYYLRSGDHLFICNNNTGNEIRQNYKKFNYKVMNKK